MRKIGFCLIILVLFLVSLQQNHFHFAYTLSHTPISTFLFIDSRTGWIVGEDGLFKTDIGGSQWISLNKYLPRLFSSELYPYALKDGIFIDGRNGWVLSASRKLLKTTDGGLSWIDQTPNILSASYKARTQAWFLKVKFIDKDHGWVLGKTLDESNYKKNFGGLPSGADFILKTTDGGSSWSKKDLIKVVGTVPNMQFEPGNYDKFQFLDERNGWLGDSDTILETSDGGNTWALQSRIYYLEDFIFVDKNNGWAVDWFGKISCTHNGGKEWLLKELGKDYLFDRVGFVDQEHGWVAGGLKKAVGPYEGILLGTNNGGETWNIQYRAAGKFLFPFFIDSQHGWLVIVKSSIAHEMNEIRIVYTSDGGRTWIPLFNGEDPLPR